jgi:hypothetical protein
MGVSRQSYAAQRGVSEAAVRKAIATGRITNLLDGSIDPARADSAWCAPDPVLRSGGAAIKMVTTKLRDTGTVPSKLKVSTLDACRSEQGDDGGRILSLTNVTQRQAWIPRCNLELLSYLSQLG